MGRSSEHEHDQRLKLVYEALLLGETRWEIIQKGSKWEISERSIDEYIATARKLLQEINSHSYEENRMLVLRNLWTVYKAALNANNIKEQRMCLSDIADITGLKSLTINVPKDSIPEVDAFNAASQLAELNSVH